MSLSPNAASRSHILIICLGDLGRSPRMQYHALSCAKAGFKVTFVGYLGSDCMDEINQHPNIKVLRFETGIKSSLSSESGNLRLFLAPIKQFFLFYHLLALTLTLSHTHILVQNPPSLPTLAYASFLSWLHNSIYIIDFHNFSYTLLNLPYRLVRFALAYERYFARHADICLCVSKSMRNWLANEWNIEATVLYDRPPHFFKKSPDKATHIRDIHELFTTLQNEEYIKPITDSSSPTSRNLHPSLILPSSTEMHNHTLLTTFDKSTNTYSYRKGRPALLLSSTSWTADEDFTILIEALNKYEQIKNGNIPSSEEEKEVDTEDDLVASIIPLSLATLVHRIHNVKSKQSIMQYAESLPPLIVIITGKGPLLSSFLSSLPAYRNIIIYTLYLPYSLYPTLLSSADFGLSFHTSSSGLDLPMKVVDCFGANLPVCAIQFQLYMN